MSMMQVCQTWRRSWLEILDVRSDPVLWLRLAETRKRYLDEMERRDASGFARWLTSGPRAGGDPSSYLSAPARPGNSTAADDATPEHPPTD